MSINRFYILMMLFRHPPILSSLFVQNPQDTKLAAEKFAQVAEAYGKLWYHGGVSSGEVMVKCCALLCFVEHRGAQQ